MQPGSRLGPYEIIDQLGKGGMCEVFRASDTRLKRDVALKVLHPDIARDSSRRERLEREARAVAAFNHPNVVALYDFGKTEDHVYLVTELVKGETLRNVRLSLGEAIEVAAQIAEGLAAAHNAGVTHRDLKPDNVMVTPDRRAKILDFGLAKIAQKQVASDVTQTLPGPVTHSGTLMGTVGYMSPEQTRGEWVDHRSDIFSFGAMLYEMLSGQRAFLGATSIDTMAAILNTEPPDLPNSIPPNVRQIVARCLAKQPTQRFQSATEVAVALRAQSSRLIAVTESALPDQHEERQGLGRNTPQQVSKSETSTGRHTEEARSRDFRLHSKALRRTVRNEGLSERGGDLVVWLERLNSASRMDPVSIDITVTLTAPLSGYIERNELDCLLFDESTPQRISYGTRTTSNSIVFSQVLMVPMPTANHTVIRISNVRCCIPGAVGPGGNVLASVSAQLSADDEYLDGDSIHPIATVQQGLVAHFDRVAKLMTARIGAEELSVAAFTVTFKEGFTGSFTNHDRENRGTRGYGATQLRMHIAPADTACRVWASMSPTSALGLDLDFKDIARLTYVNASERRAPSVEVECSGISFRAVEIPANSSFAAGRSAEWFWLPKHTAQRPMVAEVSFTILVIGGDIARIGLSLAPVSSIASPTSYKAESPRFQDTGSPASVSLTGRNS